MSGSPGQLGGLWRHLQQRGRSREQGSNELLNIGGDKIKASSLTSLLQNQFQIGTNCKYIKFFK